MPNGAAFDIAGSKDIADQTFLPFHIHHPCTGINAFSAGDAGCVKPVTDIYAYRTLPYTGPAIHALLFSGLIKGYAERLSVEKYALHPGIRTDRCAEPAAQQGEVQKDGSSQKNP